MKLTCIAGSEHWEKVTGSAQVSGASYAATGKHPDSFVATASPETTVYLTSMCSMHSHDIPATVCLVSQIEHTLQLCSTCEIEAISLSLQFMGLLQAMIT